MAVFIGTLFDDRITGTPGDDILLGQEGNDTLNGGAGNDALLGGKGNDTITALEGLDSIEGGEGTDTLLLADFSSQTVGLVIRSFGDPITLTTGNTIIGVECFANITTGSGDDYINFTEDFNEIISTGAGNDIVVAGGGDDTIDGGSGDDTINGARDNDTIAGGLGNDHLIGGGGDDTLVGGEGNDRLNGHRGTDLLTGGAGADQFIFDIKAGFNKIFMDTDTITDFSTAELDKIVLSKTTFTALTSSVGEGFSKAAEFAIVNTDALAATSAASIVYNSATGKLFYNPNGAAQGFGSKATGGEFAIFTGIPALSAADFAIQA